MRLDIEPPVHGWATIRLTAEGVYLEFVASYVPYDSIGDLARAAVDLLTGLPEQVVSWNTEPMEYDFQFVTAGGRTCLKVHQYPDSRRRRQRAEVPVATVEGDTTSLARAIWRGLRRLQGAVPAEAFAAAWRSPFPSEAVERIGDLLRG
jgi:hypothetical protein